MFKQLLRCALAAMLCSSCAVMTGNGSGAAHSKTGADDAMVAQAWSDFTLRTMKRVHGTPVTDARALGYIGLTMYESVVNSDARYQSVAGQLASGLAVPKPLPNAKYDWNLVLNSAQAQILRNFFDQKIKAEASGKKFISSDSRARAHAVAVAAETASTGDIDLPAVAVSVADNEDSEDKVVYEDEDLTRIVKKLDALEAKLATQLEVGVDPAVVFNSKKYGQDVANAVYEYSKTDHTENLEERFIEDYVPPKSGKGYWVQPDSGNSQVPDANGPLFPLWGEHRTFLANNGQLPMPEILPYSEQPDSAYYKDFLAVYEASKHLTPEQMEIAAWWSDDPSKYYSPAAHSYYLANLVVKQAKPSLIKAAQTYAGVGMATSDAFTAGWKVKFHYYSERPKTYINRVIDADWTQIWPEPPFPAFISGHGVQSGAATQVLSDLYGDAFVFTDDAYQGRDDEALYDSVKQERVDIEFINRSFTSFSQLAQEIADSRFYGGIHTPQDNIEGLKFGRAVGKNISQLGWKR